MALPKMLTVEEMAEISYNGKSSSVDVITPDIERCSNASGSA